MLTTDSFSYTLPDVLIAKYPATSRTASRLLCLDGGTGQIQHQQFADIVELINPGDLLILNNTKVMSARLFGRKQSGGKVELLIDKITDQQTAIAYIKSSKPVKPGTVIQLERAKIEIKTEAEVETGVVLNAIPAAVIIIARMDTNDGRYVIGVHNRAASIAAILDSYGNIPLPPYMKRNAEITDSSRYQTVYSKELGSVAAPTAGLHFDAELLQTLVAKGVNFAEVTLHIGSGTFQPVRVTNIADHQMHMEQVTVSQEVCDKIVATKAAGGRVFAVGTTATRAVETAAKAAATDKVTVTDKTTGITAAAATNIIQPYHGDTNLFITPGFNFKVIDGMITNFHLPCSTLLMLVCALAGTENVLHAYLVAVQQEYRFYSYGDAMFVIGGTKG